MAARPMHAIHVAPWERALVAGLSRFAGPTSQHWFPEARRRAQQISEDNEPKLSAIARDYAQSEKR